MSVCGERERVAAFFFLSFCAQWGGVWGGTRKKERIHTHTTPPDADSVPSAKLFSSSSQKKKKKMQIKHTFHAGWL